MDSEKPKNNTIFRICKAIVWFVVISWAFIYKWYLDFKSEPLTQNEKIIFVKKGENIFDIAQKLEINKNYLRIYIKNNHPELKILSGNFKISKNASIQQIIQDLETPIITGQTSVTILEWWNIFDIDEYLATKGLIQNNDYISYVRNLEKIKKLSEFFPFLGNQESLEWYLYPDTYKVKSEAFQVNEFVIQQLENFEKKVYSHLIQHPEIPEKSLQNSSHEQSIYDLINLASIVEKEEKNPKEKATVAGILKKRLESGWKIGADITVCYPHELTSEECKMVVSK